MARELFREGPQNRKKKLASILFDLNERRLAKMVASKMYGTRPSEPHILSWEMGTATSNATSDSHIETVASEKY